MNLRELPKRLLALVRRRPRLSAGIAAAVLLLLILWTTTGGNKTPATAYFEARKGSFTVSIVEGGTLQAVRETIVRNEVAGRESRIIYIVPEGTYVKEGDLLVEFDAMEAQQEVDEQQIRYEQAQFALVQAEQELAIQKSLVESEVRAAELKVQFAEMDLEKYLEGEAKVELLTVSNDITRTEAQLSIDRDTLRWSQELYEKGYETKNVLDRDQLSVTNQELALEIQKMQLWMLQNYDFERRKTELESNVDEARRDLERVKQQGDRKMAQFTADLITQSNTAALNRLRLERERLNLEATEIYAPQEGLVVYAISEGRFSSESMIEEGALVRRRQELIKLPDTSSMKVTIKVHESHVNMVQRGQPAFVKLDSMPDQRFNAYVGNVALLPDTQSRWGNPNLKVYNTDVVITDKLPDVKPGVSAQVEIVVTNVADAVSVPIQAVATLNGEQVVYRHQAGRDVPVPVEVGLFNTRFIEVVKGIEEGDRVLLTPPYDTQEENLTGSLLAAGEAATLTNAPRVLPPSAQGVDRGEGRRRATEGEGSREFGSETTSRSDSSFDPAAGGGDMRARFEQMRARFDTNGDGELDETEREAMRTELQSQFGGGSWPRGGGGEGRESRGGRARGGGAGGDMPE